MAAGVPELAVAVAQRLRRIMDEERLTQEQVATLAGVNQSSVSGWIRSHQPRMPLMEPLARFCLQLGYSLDWVVTGRGPRKVDAATERADQIYVDGARAALGEVQRVVNDVAGKWAGPEAASPPAPGEGAAALVRRQSALARQRSGRLKKGGRKAG